MERAREGAVEGVVAHWKLWTAKRGIRLMGNGVSYLKRPTSQICVGLLLQPHP